MQLRDSPANTVRVFLPKRYGSIISVDDIHHINTHAVELNLVFKGTFATTNSYILTIEQKYHVTPTFTINVTGVV
jgi:hypothetical protein